MHVLCAPDSFKESLDAVAVARAMARGANDARRDVTIDRCPVSDGGEGLLDILVAALHGAIHRRLVSGPLGPEAGPVEARFGIVRERALGIVELAEAAGLALVPRDRRDPTRTTTYGVGELIGAAIDEGCREVIVGIGGSATVDGGCGLAQALGAAYFDDTGRRISPPLTGGTLRTVARYERPQIPARLRVACDVTNPLTGPDGAAAVYGPQKGATRQQVKVLDDALAHLAALTGYDASIRGAGAAGGAGFGLMAFCGATLESGIDLVLELLGFESRCARADLVLTGEGRLDGQSLHGKACLGVARAAHRLGKPCIAIVGQAAADASRCCDAARGGYLARYVSLAERFGLERAMTDTAQCIEAIACEVVREM